MYREKFNIGWGRNTAISAMLFLLGVILLLAGVGYAVSEDMYESYDSIVFGSLCTLAAVCLLWNLAMLPRYIVLEEHRLVLQRGLGRVVIHLHSIVAAETRYTSFEGDVCLLGSNGCFGFLGKYGSQHYGKYISYVTDTKSMFWIFLGGGNAIRYAARTASGFSPNSIG